jgi:hypothetical protein
MQTCAAAHQRTCAAAHRRRCRPAPRQTGARRSHPSRCRLDRLSHLSYKSPAVNALMAVVRIFSTRCSAGRRSRARDRVALGATFGNELGAALGVKFGLLLGDELGLVLVHMVLRVTLGYAQPVGPALGDELGKLLGDERGPALEEGRGLHSEMRSKPYSGHA